MEPRKQNIDDLFREELGGYTEPPPPAVWNALNKKLAAARPTPPRFADRGLWGLAALCLVAMLLLPVMRGKWSTGGQEPSRNEQPAIAANSTAPGGHEGTNTPTTTANYATTNGTNDAGDNGNMGGTAPDPDKGGMHSAENREHSGDKGSRGATNEDNRRENGYTRQTRHSSDRQYGQRPTTRNTNTNGLRSHKNSNNRNAAGQDEDNDVAVNNYNSTTNSNKPISKTNDNEAGAKSEVKTETVKEQVPEVKKQNPTTNTANKPLVKIEQKKVKPHFNLFEMGVKAGYEGGFDNAGGKKAVVSPYLQVNLSPKISIMTQPGIKIGNLDQRRIGGTQSYYKANNDSTASLMEPSKPVYAVIEDSTVVFAGYLSRFKYSQSRDSIVKSNAIGGTYMEAELPILLKYAVSKHFSVYGGVNILYSKSVGVSEHTSTFPHLVQTAIDTVLTPTAPVTATRNTADMITFNGENIANYKGPAYPATVTDMWRVGYMLGFSFQLSNHWMVDGLVQQAGAKPNVQAGYNTNTALSVPYFRFTLGYKLK